MTTFQSFIVIVAVLYVLSVQQCEGLAGMGMGMGKTLKKKKSKASGKTKFDANASLMKCENLYDNLLKKYEGSADEEEGEDYNVSEFIIACRCSDENKKIVGFQDWVPVAQLVLVLGTGFESSIPLQKALSLYCREIHAAGIIAAPVLGTACRTSIQYSAEDVSSWQKFVYDDIIEQQSIEGSMSRSEARSILEISESPNRNDDRAEIKKAWRKKSFEYHPDRFVGIENSEDAQAAPSKLEAVNLAYETLSSGLKSSSYGWYESLGGKQRTEFCGPIELISIAKATKDSEVALNLGGFRSSVVSIAPDIAMTFVARNQANSK